MRKFETILYLCELLINIVSSGYFLRFKSFVSAFEMFSLFQFK